MSAYTSNTYTIVSVEGNIGSGKTTLLENLRREFDNCIFLREPVDEWAKITDEKGVTILEKFYEDQSKYAFSFQMMAYISRLKLLRETVNENENKYRNKHMNFTIITERSLHTDRMVFAKMLHDSGKIEHINYQIYLSWFDSFSRDYPIHKVVYVRADPAICYQRICKRSREGESNIPLAYLEECDKYHEAMLDLGQSDTCICMDQLRLDGNQDIYATEGLVAEWVRQIDEFIRNG